MAFSVALLRQLRLEDAKRNERGEEPAGPRVTRIGRNVRYAVEDLDAWVDSYRESADGVGREFTSDEWQTLYEYERDFNVKQSVLTGFPGTEPGSIDYGMASATASSGFVGEWVGDAGDELFPYVNLDGDVPVEIAAWGAQPRGDISVEVRPLLVDANDNEERLQWNGSLYLLHVKHITPMKSTAENKIELCRIDPRKKSEKTYIWKCASTEDRDFWVMGLRQHQQYIKDMIQYMAKSGI